MGNVQLLRRVQLNFLLGIPLNDTSNLRLGIAEAGETILGDKLIGFQVGNEPDQYALCVPSVPVVWRDLIRCRHGHRPLGYSPANFSSDFGIVDAALRADPKVPVVNGKLIGPSLSGVWQPQDVWDVNFIPDHQKSLAELSMSFYPNNNCAEECANDLG